MSRLRARPLQLTHSARCALTVTLLLLACWPQSARAQERVLATVRSDSAQISAVAAEKSAIAIRVVDNGNVRELPLSSTVRSVSALAISPTRRRVGVIGSAGGSKGDEIAVIDVASQSILTSVYGLAAALSSDNRFVVFQTFPVPYDPKAPTQYAFIDLDAPGGRMPAPNVFYPREAGQHDRKSDFFWIEKDIVAVLDRSGPTSQLVVMQVAPDGTIGRLVVKPLDPALLVNEGVVEPGKTASMLLYEPAMNRVESDTGGLMIRLKFPADPSLKARRVDVQVW